MRISDWSSDVCSSDLPRVADRQLEAGRLAAGQFAQAGDEFQQPYRRGERRMPRRRDAVQPLRHAAGGGDLGTDLGPGQHAAVAGLGALRELELDHLHLRIARVGGETFLAEAAVLLAAAEVARADFPDQVAAVLARKSTRLNSSHYCANR